MLQTGPPVTRALVIPDWHRYSPGKTWPQPSTRTPALLSGPPVYVKLSEFVGMSITSWGSLDLVEVPT